MKNILYVHAGAELYGADKILLEIVTGLDKSKFHPIVVLPNDGVLVNELKKNNIEVYVVEYPILRRKYFNPKGLFRYVNEYKKQSYNIISKLKNRKIDIIHVNTTAVLEGIFLKKKLNAKLLWHIHEIIMRPWFVHYIITFLISKYADKIVVVSSAVKKHLVNSRLIKNSRIRVIYNGVANNNLNKEDVKYLFDEFKIPRESIKIGMIGRINSWKGQSDFIKAVTPILKGDKKAFAFIIGGVFDGEEWRVEKIREEIINSGVSNQIYLSDFRTDTEYLFKFFDLFVLPSTLPDPLPTVVLEAMAAAKPIVGYRHGGVTEMVEEGKNGFLAAPLDIKQLTNSMEKILSDVDMVKHFGEISLERQRNLFSKELFKNKFDRIYNSLL